MSVLHSTGMKCLPRHKLETAAGCILHDSHAETLAIRSFNQYLLSEAAKMSRCRTRNTTNDFKAIEYESDIIVYREKATLASINGDKRDWQPPFKIREDVSIFMYCSEAPCGDASMELVMNKQNNKTSWPIETDVNREEIHMGELKGRSHFSQLGVVRRKPGMIPKFLLSPSRKAVFPNTDLLKQPG